ncbi:hypothetical protein M758_2G021200 [Ceratodon purpureus]|nr:hypothetical protein M758_2G021200 [Ceratodon purpureus]
MAKSKELCGSCCKGSQPIRKSFNECRLCACGAPFFSQIVVESNLPTSRRCLIEIPREFIEDHGYRFDKMDKTVILEEEDGDSEVYRVKIGGNNFVGFGFEWRDFVQAHNIGIGQTVVFTLVRNSRFLVQIYKPSVEQACPALIAPKVEVEDDDDDIEICQAQDWMAAKASRSSTTYPVLASEVKVEHVFSETSTDPNTRELEKQGGIDAKGKQKCGIVPKVEADSEIINGGYSVQPTPPKEFHVFTASVREGREERVERSQASPHCSSTDDYEDNEDSDSTSDSSYSPHGDTRRNPKRGVSSGSETVDEDEDGVEDGVEDELVSSTVGRRGKRLFSEGSSNGDKTRGKRVRPSDMDPSPNDEVERNGTRSGLLVEGSLIKKHGHEWHKAGTKRGRTYVSKRRPVTEAEKMETLERARQVPINNPSFLKQLHKDSCYRSLKLFPPTVFYRDNMISATKGSYKATLEDESGNKWTTRIMGMKIFWKHFTLDHNLEQDDVVVFELMDSRHESVRFLVHIFRVVDIKKTHTGKAGWAIHYDVVDGTKKQYFEERRRLLKAQGLDKQKKQKHKQTDGSSSNPKSDAEIDKMLQKEKPTPSSPNASRTQVELRTTWKRPMTRIKRT